jgi:hypothetical protein
MFKMKLFLTLFGFTLVSFASMAQPERVPSYFGVQFRPIFPAKVVGSKQTTMTGNGYAVNVTQKIGYSFGGTVRAGITKLIAFETGISFVQQNFDLTMSVPEFSISTQDDISFICYETPLNALFYVQLDQRVFMNASLGIALRFSPSDIQKTTETGGSHSFYNKGLYTSKIGFNVNGNYGFEFRTDKKGIYYFGGSVAVPLKPLFNLISIHEVQQQTASEALFGGVNGSYLALDFKYFFPLIKQKGIQPFQGPIE